MQDRDLFKGRRVDNEEWVVGYLYRLSERHNPFIMLYNKYGESHEVDQSTICRCTGSKDKNGKLVWENDIMEAHLDDMFPEDVTRTKVIWDKNAWVTIESGSVDRHYLDDFDTEYYEIIGNIFDNPELLESEE